MATELKPCPFCGRKHLLPHHTPGGFVWITCPGCGTSGPIARTLDDANKDWNTRKAASDG